MPPKKSTTPPPAKVKAGKTKAAPPKVNKPVIIPHRPATAPAEKLVPRRGWKGAPLPFNDIDSALAWGFGDMKLADAEDQADAFKASDAHHRGRAKFAEDELRTLPKRDAAGVLRSRDLRRAERADNPDAPPIPANVVGGPRRRGRAHSAEARGRQPAAPETPAPAPKKEPPPAPKKEPPPAPTGPKKEPPAPAGPEKEPEAAAASRRLAAEKAEEAYLKEERFREEKQRLEEALVKYRRAKTRIPDELKAKQKIYNGKALQQLTNARLAAEKLVAEARIANAGTSRREAAKKNR